MGRLPPAREIERLLNAVVDEQSASGDPDKYDFEAGLLSAGCDREVAVIMADMIPDAFGQIILREMGVRLVDQADFRWPDGSVRPAPLSSDPIWKAISRVAEAMASGAETRPAFARVARGGSSIDALSKALNSGASIEGAVFAVAFVKPPRRWSLLDRLL